MKVTYTAADLIAFEDEMASLFADKLIHAPVHLSGNNESQLIDIFDRYVNPEDWVLSHWRSHYHALLKGVPVEQVRQAIIAGRSISLCFPEYRFLSSGIVGGTAPIAVGLAMGIKRKREAEYAAYSAGTTYGAYESRRIAELKEPQRKVVCFLGDTSAETGIVHESIKYAIGFDLPVLFVIEDNGLSVSTETAKAWGKTHSWLSFKVLRYRYKLTKPHVGIGKYVEF